MFSLFCTKHELVDCVNRLCGFKPCSWKIHYTDGHCSKLRTPLRVTSEILILALGNGDVGQPQTQGPEKQAVPYGCECFHIQVGMKG